ncbi:MAG: hypothetical protein ISP90_02635 [Nevskia sp.]|nr:hypothetical protein [Nevskia sp.]
MALGVGAVAMGLFPPPLLSNLPDWSKQFIGWSGLFLMVVGTIALFMPKLKWFRRKTNEQPVPVGRTLRLSTNDSSQSNSGNSIVVAHSTGSTIVIGGAHNIAGANDPIQRAVFTPRILIGSGTPFDVYRKNLHATTHTIRIGIKNNSDDKALTNCHLTVESISGKLASKCPVTIKSGFALNPGATEYFDFIEFDEVETGKPALSHANAILAYFPINKLSNGKSYLDEQPYSVTLKLTAAECAPCVSDYRIWIQNGLMCLDELVPLERGAIELGRKCPGLEQAAQNHASSIGAHDISEIKKYMAYALFEVAQIFFKDNLSLSRSFTIFDKDKYGSPVFVNGGSTIRLKDGRLLKELHVLQRDLDSAISFYEDKSLGC